LDTLLSVHFARSVKDGSVHAAAALAIADVLGYCDHPPDSVVYLEFINQIRTLPLIRHRGIKPSGEVAE
jgi:hypothetical protein